MNEKSRTFCQTRIVPDRTLEQAYFANDSFNNLASATLFFDEILQSIANHAVSRIDGEIMLDHASLGLGQAEYLFQLAINGVQFLDTISPQEMDPNTHLQDYERIYSST